MRLHILTNRINKLALEDKMITEKAEDTEAKANIIFEVKRREQIKVIANEPKSFSLLEYNNQRLIFGLFMFVVHRKRNPCERRSKSMKLSSLIL